MGMRSVAVEFDTLTNAKHSDMKKQHVGLNINGLDKSVVAVESSFPLTSGDEYTAWVDYDPWSCETVTVFLKDSNVKPNVPLLQGNLSLCEVLQPTMQQPAFFFGFVASTTVKPFQRHAILKSGMSAGKYLLSGLLVMVMGVDMKASEMTILGRICTTWGHPILPLSMGLTDTKCTSGGSPTAAFEKLVTLDGSSGLKGGSNQGYEGLMLAVRRQPVVVHIEAVADTFRIYDGTFKYQDPACYTGSLNHVVLVIGYFINRDDGSQNRIAPPFWIIRNSWGVGWGDCGHMSMAIEGGDGVCGINVLPGIYPIVKRTPVGEAAIVVIRISTA
ncbi:unnamed protein product [Closterium sp. NIES-65]|nr:unnamed protein product [Closterium sp. NIES-65]